MIISTADVEALSRPDSSSRGRISVVGSSCRYGWSP